MGETPTRSGKGASKTPTDPEPAPPPQQQDLLPRLLQDPLLEPVDKVVWLVIRQYVEAYGTKIPWPSLRQLALRANIASASTVSRAVAILRITRWITLSADTSAPDGRQNRACYRLAGPHLSLSEVRARDADYLLFLERACDHPHAQVRRVAQAALKAIETENPGGRDPAVQEQSTKPSAAEGENTGRRPLGGHISFCDAGMARLQNATGSDPTQQPNPATETVGAVRFLNVQKLTVQKSNAQPSSSCCLYKPTTTTTADVQNSNNAAETPPLVFPQRLSPNQREAAIRDLADLAEAERQAVLDELEGRLRAERHGAKPVYDAVRYLRHLCGQVKAGHFEPNLGLGVRNERRKRERDAERAKQRHRDLQQTLRGSRERRDVSAELAALKSALGPSSDQEVGAQTSTNRSPDNL